MLKKFTPSPNMVIIYAKEFLQRLNVIKKLESNQKYTDSRIEEITYNEMRNHRRELFENPIEWRIAIMTQYRKMEKEDQLKELNQKETSEKKESTLEIDRQTRSIANGLNKHDRDEDEPMEKIEIKIPENTSLKTPTVDEDEKPSPMQEGRINVSCISKKEYRKKLEDEYKSNIGKAMLR